MQKGIYLDADYTAEATLKQIDDKGYLITADGEKIDLTNTQVTVEVPISAVSMSDDAELGGACGNIFSLIYKGNHYNYIVRTENEEDYILDDDDCFSNERL